LLECKIDPVSYKAYARDLAIIFSDDDADIQYSSYGEDKRLMLDILFPLLSPSAPTKLQVSKLLLRNLDFWTIGSRLVDALDTEKLESLVFWNCNMTTEPLTELQAKPLRLRHLVDDSCPLLTNDHITARNVAGFFKAFRGLEHLRMSRRGRAFSGRILSLDAIQQHAESLRILFLGDDTSYAWGDRYANPGNRPMADFKVTCASLCKLQQLAIRTSDIRGDLVNALIDNPNLAAFLEAIEQLPELASLRLITFPDFLARKASDIAEERWEESERLGFRMKSLANTIFTRLHLQCPKFRALQIDVRRAEEDAWCTSAALGFLRERRIDPYNQMRIHACPVELKTPRAYTPYHEILLDGADYAWVA
jgi:hypothetical protein